MCVFSVSSFCVNGFMLPLSFSLSPFPFSLGLWEHQPPKLSSSNLGSPQSQFQSPQCPVSPPAFLLWWCIFSGGFVGVPQVLVPGPPCCPTQCLTLHGGNLVCKWTPQPGGSLKGSVSPKPSPGHQVHIRAVLPGLRMGKGSMVPLWTLWGSLL